MTCSSITRIAALAVVAVAALARVAAQEEPTVSAHVNAARIGEGDSVTLTVEVKGGITGGVEEPDLSGLADFTVAAGPGVSTSTSMVWRGGQASSSTTRQFSYALLPRRRGSLTIPTISVRIGSRIYRTNPISVEVVEGRVRSAPQPRSGRGIINPESRDLLPEGEISVESETDRRTAYVGEQILLTYTVYTQMELVEVPSPQQLPSYTGFWVEEIPHDPRSSVRRVQRGGKEFIAVTLMKKALFPTTSGRLTIEGTAFGLPVRARSRDPFDSIFFTPTKMLYRKTAPLTINVRPLPVEGRPASFTGAVGDYRLSVQVDRTETNVDEALGLHVSVEGTGNIRMVGTPALPVLSDYKTYEPKVEETRKLDKDRLSGRKSWDYVLTPLAPGPQDIPPIRFSWFDPRKIEYVETSSKPIPVVVARSAASSPGIGAALPPAREVTAIARDIRYIKPVSSLATTTEPFHRSARFLALLAAPALLNAALFAVVRRRERMSADSGWVRRRRAAATARRGLRAARGTIESGDEESFHDQVGAALTGYLGDRLGVSAAGLTREEIAAALIRRRVEPDLLAGVNACLDRCDFARFAPASPGPRERQELLDQAGSILEKLERRLGEGE